MQIIWLKEDNPISGPFIQNFVSSNLLACVQSGLLIVGFSFSVWDTKELNFKEQCSC